MSEKEKEEYAGLVENEAKTVEGDATQMQQYPPAYPADTATTVMPPQAVTTTQSAPVLTYQPQPYGWDGQTQGFSSPAVARAAADRMTVISIIMCILCCLCGSPLTLACLVPAIIFSVKVNDYAAHGDATGAQKALLAARVLTVIGVVSGVVILVIAIILRVVGSN